MGRQVFTAGEILTAASMNDLGDQTVMVFDDATDRATAIPTPVEGMVTYLKDTDAIEKFDGTNFVAAAPPQTGVLQVVSTTLHDIYAVTLAQGVIDSSDVTGLTATITPTSASSKLLVFLSLSQGGNVSGFNYILFRDGSASAAIGGASGSKTRTSGGMQSAGGDSIVSTNVHYLDDAGATSATTYSVRIHNGRPLTQTFFVNRSGADDDANHGERAISTLTIMEVAG